VDQEAKKKMNREQIETLRAFVDAGGKLNHENAVELLAELERARKVIDGLIKGMGEKVSVTAR
jgi:CRISPR/Cas system Type II protein with McrA/HNH and RuvC-like nuclease domain